MHRSGADGSDDQVVDAVLAASRALVAVAARSVAEVDGALTLPQFRALVALGSRGPQNVGALADDLGVHPSTASRMCDRLAGRSLIARAPSPSSRREVIVRLSPAGRRLLRGVTIARRKAIGEVVGKVPPPQRPAMIAALQAFSDAAGEVPDQAWAVGWDR
jgi:DNA-binding MarR family transcriptional regulator